MVACGSKAEGNYKTPFLAVKLVLGELHDSLRARNIVVESGHLYTDDRDVVSR